MTSSRFVPHASLRRAALFFVAAVLLLPSAAHTADVAPAEPPFTHFIGRLDINPGDACTKLKEPQNAGMNRALFTEPETFVCADAGGRRSQAFDGLQLCSIGLGFYEDGMKALVVRRGNAVQLRCLYASIDLSCTPPNAAVPDWPRPTFAGPQDDRCDRWKRGPVVAAESSRPEGPWRDAVLRQQARVAPLLDFEPPRLLAARIVNPVYGAAGGEPATVPEVSLRRALGNRPTIALLVFPGCNLCVQVLETLHKRFDRFTMSSANTTYADAQLVVLVLSQKGTDGRDAVTLDEATAALMDDIRRRFPGRAVYAIDEIGGLITQPLQPDPPWLLMVDANGYIRASTSGRLFPGPQKADTWSVLRNPAWLLNVAFSPLPWEAPRAATLDEAAAAWAQGRLPSSLAAAPDSITLPPAVLQRAQALAAQSAAERLEYGTELILEGGKGVRLTEADKGLPLAVQTNHIRLRDEMHALQPCADCPATAHVVGGFHTHPNEGWYSKADVEIAARDRQFSLLAMKGGMVGLLLPTHDAHDVRRGVNPVLTSERLGFNRQQGVWYDFYGRSFGPERLSVGTPPRSTTIDAWARTFASPDKDFKEEVVRSAYEGAKRAQSSGLALYVGRDARLQRVDLPPLDTTPKSWTGNAPGVAAEERGLSAADRTIIAALLRANAGDRDAFCNAKLEDIFLPAFSKATREMIRQLPAALKATDPYAPPMRTAGKGYFDDEDLQAFLEMVNGRSVEIFQGFFMGIENRGCVMHWSALGADMKTPTKRPGLWLGKAVKMYEDLGRARSFGALSFDNVQMIGYGEDAQRYGCADVALVSARDGKVDPVRCDAVIKR